MSLQFYRVNEDLNLAISSAKWLRDRSPFNVSNLIAHLELGWP